MTIIHKFDPSEGEKKFPKRYVVMITSSLFILTLIEIWANNTVVAYGDKYEKLNALENNLKMENQILENEIAKNSSLGVIASKSAQLGFSSHQSIKYIR